MLKHLLRFRVKIVFFVGFFACELATLKEESNAEETLAAFFAGAAWPKTVSSMTTLDITVLPWSFEYVARMGIHSFLYLCRNCIRISANHSHHQSWPRVCYLT